MPISHHPAVQSVAREIGGRTLTIESGWLAKQAAGAAVVSFGETAVLAAVVDGGERELDFFPLTVEYREKTYAAGKIPGGFFKREGRPTTKEILASRLTDRAVRPMFAEGYRNDLQILSNVLSYDQENEPEALSMIAAFAALHLSSIPFQGPMGAVRLGWLGGRLVVNPTRTILDQASNRLDLTLGATRDALVMVEAGAQDLPESEILRALRAGHEVCRQVCDMMDELRAKLGAPAKQAVAPPVEDRAAQEEVRGVLGAERVRAALLVAGKHERKAALAALEEQALAALAPSADTSEAVERQARVRAAVQAVANAAERSLILEGVRVDGRDTRAIRPISIEVGLLPRAHGSALFTRGETQALVTATLGSYEDEQILDGLRTEEERARFLLHYNFPPFSVGEVRPLRGTSRREYGHGALAERALRPALPDYEAFPYTLRVVSEILESNGSSSMATVCGSSLALMDAGVPVKAPVAGIAMGLVKDGDRFVILSDILGSEDHHGDMDFKVAGTREGITALQMDVKVKGLPESVLAEALEQARVGRLHILDQMAAVLPRHRDRISAYAPVNRFLSIPPDKIGFLIGPKGATIRKLQEDFGVTINIIGDDGTVQVSGTPAEKVEEAIQTIRGMTRELEVGTRLRGHVVSVKPFGCFVDLGGGQEGLVHISELAEGRVNEVSDVCKIGDEIDVVVVSVDDAGKVRLSRRLALLPDDQIPALLETAQRPSGRGGPRDHGGPRNRGGSRQPQRGQASRA